MSRAAHYSGEERRRRIALLVILAISSVMLWQTPIGNVLLYPFTILATWFHESGHGIAAALMGGDFERLLVFSDGSGLAESVVPNDTGSLAQAFIAAAGPLGPAIAGSGLILASMRVKSATYTLYALGAALLVSTLIWVATPTGWIVLPLIGLAILAIALRAAADTRIFAVQFLGVQAAISTYRQTDYLFTEGAMLGGYLHRSDTGVIAQHLSLPCWFWGGAISVLILLMLGYSLYYALRR